MWFNGTKRWILTWETAARSAFSYQQSTLDPFNIDSIVSPKLEVVFVLKPDLTLTWLDQNCFIFVILRGTDRSGCWFRKRCVVLEGNYIHLFVVSNEKTRNHQDYMR